VNEARGASTPPEPTVPLAVAQEMEDEPDHAKLRQHAEAMAVALEDFALAHEGCVGVFGWDKISSSVSDYRADFPKP